jgi:hypothetical protein
LGAISQPSKPAQHNAGVAVENGLFTEEGLRSPKRACGGAAESAEEGGIGESMPRDRGVVEENVNVQHMHLHLQTKDAERTAHIVRTMRKGARALLPAL